MLTALAKQTRIVPSNATGNTKSRLGQFEKWLAETNRDWTMPDLANYRDFLLSRLSPNSAKAHLSTIRARYQMLIRDNTTRDALFEYAGNELERLGMQDTIANRKAMADEIITRLENSTHPSHSKVKVETIQDVVDAAHIRLTFEQAQTLINAPGLIPLKRLRDTAIIALMLSTGIRESELCNLQVCDLRQTVNGVLCLHVRQGKGAKTRAIPYGAMDAVLVVVDKWLEMAGITDGFVFRGFFKDGRTMRQGKLSTRAIQRTLANYPIVVSGKLTTVKPHDLRRTYARLQYESGMDILALSQNLGHAGIETTQNYIGNLAMDARAPKGAFSFDLSTLDKLNG